MANPPDALYFRDIMLRGYKSANGRSLAWITTPISVGAPRAEQARASEAVRQQIAALLEDAELFYVSSEISAQLVALTNDMTDVGRLYHFEPDDWPSPYGVMYFDGNHVKLPVSWDAHVNGMHPPGTTQTLRAIAWGVYAHHDQGEAKGKIIYSWMDNSKAGQLDTPYPWRPRHCIPMSYFERFEPRAKLMTEYLNEMGLVDPSISQEDREREKQETFDAIERVVRLMFVACQFLKTDYYTTTKGYVPKLYEKRARNEKHPLPPFRIVMLRPAVAIGDKHEPLGGSPDYLFRWKVRAHYRNQRVGPGRQFVRPTLVREYTKGPPDKPLDPRPRIQAIVR